VKLHQAQLQDPYWEHPTGKADWKNGYGKIQIFKNQILLYL
jgi:hypothetical protein